MTNTETPARNVTVGRASTVHATIDNNGYTALCGGSMRRNGHRGEPTPTADPVTCKACGRLLAKIEVIRAAAKAPIIAVPMS